MPNRTRILGLAACLALAGCAGDNPKAAAPLTRVVSMGQGQFQISCYANAQASCFDAAKAACPQGHELWSNVLDPQIDYGLMTIVVKCQSG
jgi:uncharacterized lipoprotein YbaY